MTNGISKRKIEDLDKEDDEEEDEDDDDEEEMKKSFEWNEQRR